MNQCKRRIRCRNPFHSNDSEYDWTAYIDFDDEGFPYVFDEILGETHVLPEHEKQKIREKWAKRNDR